MSNYPELTQLSEKTERRNQKRIKICRWTLDSVLVTSFSQKSKTGTEVLRPHYRVHTESVFCPILILFARYKYPQQALSECNFWEPQFLVLWDCDIVLKFFMYFWGFFPKKYVRDQSGLQKQQMIFLCSDALKRLEHVRKGQSLYSVRKEGGCYFHQNYYPLPKKKESE